MKLTFLCLFLCLSICANAKSTCKPEEVERAKLWQDFMRKYSAGMKTYVTRPIFVAIGTQEKPKTINLPFNKGGVKWLLVEKQVRDDLPEGKFVATVKINGKMVSPNSMIDDSEFMILKYHVKDSDKITITVIENSCLVGAWGSESSFKLR